MLKRNLNSSHSLLLNFFLYVFVFTAISYPRASSIGERSTQFSILNYPNILFCFNQEKHFVALFQYSSNFLSCKNCTYLTVNGF